MGRQTSQESTITGSDRPLSVAASRRLLIAVGSVFALTIAAYATLWVNLPAGHQHAFGLHPPSIELFRSLWPFPEITVTAERFAHAGTLLVALQWLLYLVAIACAAAAGPWGEDQRASQATVTTAVLATVAALLFPTVLSADVYHYALQGRLFAVHGLNPYVDSGAAIADDPFYGLAVWRDMTTQYGPLWNLVAAAIGWLGAGDPVATAIGFKVVAGAAHVAATMAVVALAGRIPGGRADVAAILFGWNPILLQEAAGSGHNDSLMLALALAGVAALAAKRALVGVSLLAASIAVKYLTAILAVFAVAHVLARQTWTWRLRNALLWGVLGTATIALLYLPFAADISSPAQFFAGVTSDLNPMPNNVQDTMDPEAPLPLILAAVLVVGVLGSLVWVTRTNAPWSRVLFAYGLASFFYAFVVYGGSFAWYLVSPMAGAVLGPPGRVRFYLLALLLGIGASLMIAIVWVRPLSDFP